MTDLPEMKTIVRTDSVARLLEALQDAGVTRFVEREEAAEKEIRRRFARGEIDEDEFAARLRALRETHVTD